MGTPGAACGQPRGGGGGGVPDADGRGVFRRLAERGAQQAFAHDAEADDAEGDGGGHGDLRSDAGEV